MMVFAIEPTDHWKAGDRAYCLWGLRKDGQWILEKGRMYRVADARQFEGVMTDGLKLEGVDGYDFWSNRFVCVRGRELPYRQIQERTRRGSFGAYAATSNARAVAAGHRQPFPPEVWPFAA